MLLVPESFQGEILRAFCEWVSQPSVERSSQYLKDNSSLLLARTAIAFLRSTLLAAWMPGDPPELAAVLESNANVFRPFLDALVKASIGGVDTAYDDWEPEPIPPPVLRTLRDTAFPPETFLREPRIDTTSGEVDYVSHLVHLKADVDPTVHAEILVGAARQVWEGHDTHVSEKAQEAMAYLRKALEVSPTARAAALHLMGTICPSLFPDDPALGLERAIRNLTQARDACTDDVETGGILIDLAEALKRRAYLNWDASDYDSAELTLREAVRLFESLGAREFYARANNNLGLLLSEPVGRPKSPTQDEAVQAFDEALSVYSRDKHPRDWAFAMDNKAGVIASRFAGSPVDDLEAAIAIREEILESVYIRSANPEDRAHVAVNLAANYLNRQVGVKTENIDAALRHLDEALPAVDAAANHHLWLLAQTNLGIAYGRRSETQDADRKAEDLGRSIEHLKMALSGSIPLKSPTDVGLIELNLGNAHMSLAAIGREESAESAEAAFLAASAHFEVAAATHLEATALHNLGLLRLGAFRMQGNADDLTQARKWMEQAKTKAEAAGHEVLAFSAAMELAKLEHITQAASGYVGELESAAGAARSLLLQAESEVAQFQYADMVSKALSGIALNLLRNEDYAGALRYIESSRAILQRAGLNDKSTCSEASQAPAPAAIAVRRLEIMLRDEISPGRKQELAALLSAARREVGIHSSLAEAGSDSPTQDTDLLDLVQDLPEGVALIVVAYGSDGGYALVLQKRQTAIGKADAVRLPNLTPESLIRVFGGTESAAGYLEMVWHETPLHTQMSAIDDLGEVLWEIICGPLHEAIKRRGISDVVFCCPSEVAILPVAAAWRIADGRRRYFIDDYSIAYTPSLAEYLVPPARPLQLASERNLVVGVGSYDERPNLPFAVHEAEAVASMLGCEAMIDTSATSDAVLAKIRRAPCIHLACHGGFGWNPSRPLDFVLHLEGAERLSLSAVQANGRLDAAGLVVLSACESGMVDVVVAPSEQVGLATAFLRAGAQGVVASRWCVGDLSAFVLMMELYTALQASASPPRALREAQLSLKAMHAEHLIRRFEDSCTLESRSRTDISAQELLKASDRPFSSPYYWAPFVCYGK